VAINFLVQLKSDDISSKPKISRIFGGKLFVKGPSICDKIFLGGGGCHNVTIDHQKKEYTR